MSLYRTVIKTEKHNQHFIEICSACTRSVCECLRYAQTEKVLSGETVRRKHRSLPKRAFLWPKHSHMNRANWVIPLRWLIKISNYVITGFFFLFSQVCVGFRWSNRYGRYFLHCCVFCMVNYMTICHFIHFPLIWQYQWTLHFPVFTESSCSCFFVFCFQKRSHECLWTWQQLILEEDIHWLYTTVPKD